VQLVGECYQLTKYFPNDERFGLVSQLRRASVSVHLNIAEGASRRSDIERKRYFEIARGSVIEIDAALDIIKTLGYLENRNIDLLGKLLIQSFKMLSGMIESTKKY
jgi:four helix bundle protein